MSDSDRPGDRPDSAAPASNDGESVEHGPSWANDRSEPARLPFAWYHPRLVDIEKAKSEGRPSVWKWVAFAAAVVAGVGAILGSLAHGSDAPSVGITRSVSSAPAQVGSLAQYEKLRRNIENAFAHKRPAAKASPAMPRRELAWIAHASPAAAIAKPIPVRSARPVATAKPRVALMPLVAATPAVTPAPVATAHPTPIAYVRHEVYADRISYAGRWEAVRGRHDGRAGGMSERSFAPGATATLNFSGRGVTIYGIRGAKGGSAAIAVDGIVRLRRVSFNASRKFTHVPIFATNDLRSARHRVAITVLAQDPAGYVNVESAEIRQ